MLRSRRLVRLKRRVSISGLLLLLLLASCKFFFLKFGNFFVLFSGISRTSELCGPFL